MADFLEAYSIGVFVGSIIWGIIWGIATNKVIENKGYSENWFWWGFFFGFIAFIVALTKPDNVSKQPEKAHINPQVRERNILDSGGWKCTRCGRVNASYVTTCSCGDSLADSKRKAARSSEITRKEAERKKESDNLDMLKKYKDLLDSGVITQEEFDAKKKELIGL